jgi:1-acyl-sn-glycerol-3-phosphate acyltransferase
MINAVIRLPSVKLIRLLFEFTRGALVLWLRFPKLDHDGRLREIQRWAAKVLTILRVQVQCEAPAPTQCPALVVANHLSWLDVLVLQSLLPGVFVAKSEVRHWPGIGAMAQACATIFVERSSRQSARAMVNEMLKAIKQGYSVFAFPEGTSSDGSDVGQFHTNVFEAAIQAHVHVQPVTLLYVDTHLNLSSDTALFTGDTTLVASLRKVMASSSVQATVHFGKFILPQGHTRKSLAGQAHQSIHGRLLQIRQGLS